MKYVIVGGVAAGASAAARLRRYVLHTNAELKYGPEDRPGQPVPGHKCIGARERRVFR